MHGIGGRTVAEAQQRMSYAEFCRWLAYRRKRGTLHPGLRGDRHAALLASLYINARKNKSAQATSIYDLLPYEEEPPISMEQAMQTWH